MKQSLLLLLFLFIVFKNVLRIPLPTRKTRLILLALVILAVAIPTGAHTTITNKKIETTLLAPGKISIVLPAPSNAVI